MAQISYIKYTDVLEARRYDAEYFKPEYLEDENKITSFKWEFLKNLQTKNSRYKQPIYNNLSKIKIINSQYLREDKIDYEEARNGNNKLVPYEAIMINSTGIGTLGRVNINYLKNIKISVDSHINIIVSKNINPYYLTTFLKSKFGKNQIAKNISGSSGQIEIYPRDFSKFKIPILSQTSQNEIEEIVKLAHQKQTKSKKLYHEAEQLLLAELGLLDYQVKHSLWFTTTKKEIEKAHRYDSEYFQPKYAEIIKKIESYDGRWDLVKNQFKQNTTLSKKDGEYCNYIEISDVNTSNGEITPNKVDTKDIPANGKRKLFKNDLLISKVRPYRGAVSFIDFEVDNLIGSGAFTVLQEKTNYKKEVLMIFLKTTFIKELLLRYNCGTSYPVIKDEDILNLKIPLIKPEIQKQIAEKIQESHKLRKESKELLAEAKRKVEEEIEKK